MLQDEILNVMEQKITVNSVWREVFSRLLTVLVCKSEAPADSAMCKDDLELLRCYRQDIADTLVSSCMCTHFYINANCLLVWRNSAIL